MKSKSCKYTSDKSRNEDKIRKFLYGDDEKEDFCDIDLFDKPDHELLAIGTKRATLLRRTKGLQQLMNGKKEKKHYMNTNCPSLSDFGEEVGKKRSILYNCVFFIVIFVLFFTCGLIITCFVYDYNFFKIFNLDYVIF